MTGKRRRKVRVVVITRYGRKEKGVFAARRILKGERVSSFDGPFHRVPKGAYYLPNDPPDYLRDHAIQCGPHLWRTSRGPAKYINHSCEPNCGMRGRFALVAMRDIAKGREITFDYDMTENSVWRMKCRCGTRSCRRLIRGFRFAPKVLRSKYRGYFSTWLKPFFSRE
jgi:uncharacterized protein